MGLDNPLHIAFLLIILLLIFGAKRLPELGRSLGTGMRSFKDSISGESYTAEQVEPPANAPAEPSTTVPAEQPVAAHSPVRPVA
jgi:sec-independent protein translocase protein TatA